ncbi:MAG TPA: acyl-CoA dehydrogenase family protein [Kineosporiaceae bacterium]
MFDLDERQLALRRQLRTYFADLLTPDERRTLLRLRHGPLQRDVVRRLGRDGWLGVGWPVEYGGRGFGPVEQQIFVDEAARADVQLPAVTLQTVGPTLMEFGTVEQKDYFLPRILAGDVHFAIGYTEPESGTDLASLRTRAVLVDGEDGPEYLVNGQKIFTTGGHDVDYVWLAVRTDPAARRHHGITILIVDAHDPGYSWTPIITCDGAHHVNATYYADVRVPVSRRVGAENDGWRLITRQLNHERVMLGPAGRLAALDDRVRAWAASRRAADGRAVLAQPDVRRTLAEVTAHLRVNELLNAQVTSAPEVDVADASATKVYSSEHVQRLGQALEELVARHGGAVDDATAELLTWLDVQAKRNLVLTFGGGANEIQRELIAAAGLGLPRVPR